MDEKGYNFVQYFDLGINVVTDDGSILGQITETVKPLSFDLAIPKSLEKEGRTFHVMRVHEGKIKELGVTKDAFYTFTSDQFSTYAIGYSDKKQTVNGENNSGSNQESKPENKEEKKDKDSVETATQTNMNVFMIFMFISLGMFVLLKRYSKVKSL